MCGLGRGWWSSAELTSCPSDQHRRLEEIFKIEFTSFERTLFSVIMAGSRVLWSLGCDWGWIIGAIFALTWIPGTVRLLSTTMAVFVVFESARSKALHLLGHREQRV